MCTYEDGRRVRGHARALSGRVFLAGGEVILVRERPDPDVLFDLVKGWEARPATDPTPRDLGVPGASAQMLGRGSLATRSRAVQQWRAEVEWRLAGRAAFSEKARLREELAEIDPLSRMVVELHRLMKDPMRGVSPYWLPPAEEDAHAAAIRKHCGGKAITEDVAWLARLTHWLMGQDGLERFLTTVAGGLRSPAELQQREALVRFREAVARAIDVVGRPAAGAKHEMKRRLIRAMREADGWTWIAPIRKAHAGLPARFHTTETLGLPGRDSEIDLDQLLNRCDALLQAEPTPPTWDALAAIAAIYWTDGSTVPLSWQAASQRFPNRNAIWWTRKNADEPGYDDVLASLDALPACDLSDALRFLRAGASIEDIAWFHKESWSYLRSDHTPATLTPCRRIVEWLRSNGRGPSNDEVDAFWEAVATESGRGVAGALAAFLDGLTAPTPQQSGEVAQLIRILSVPSFRRRLVDRLVAWSAPPSRPKAPADCPENLPEELLSPLRRMAFYQRLAGEPARVPDSIRKPLEAVSRAEAEVRYLRALGEGRNAFQSDRLRRLEGRASAELPVERLLRKAREVTSLAALAAARNLVREEVEGSWRERFGVEFGDWNWQEAAQLLHWVDALDDDGRRMVRTALEAHRQHGPAYRRHLPHNADWLAQAAPAIRLDAWLAPPAETVDLKDGKTARIRLATDPRDVVLMGSRFNTCLSLKDGCNRDSVLTNAIDANKAVVYAFGPDGRPLARKLVGVTADRELVGFRLYCHEDPDQLQPAFDAYCGAWAARAGLRLADEGVPDSLGGTFWYDDGAEAWTAPAREAFAAHSPDGPTPAAPASLSPLERLHGAILSRDLAAIDELPKRHARYRWASPSAFWRVRLGGTLDAKACGNVHFQTVLQHLAAAGEVRGPIDPRRWPIEPDQLHYVRNDIAWSLFALLPPDRDHLEAGWDLALRFGQDENFDGCHCIHTCEISPAIAALPVRKVVALLRRYDAWLPDGDCDCGADLRDHWARILQLAWLRDRDPARIGRLLLEPRPLLREVALRFLRLQPDRTLQGPLRRLIRSNPGDAATPAREALDALQSRLDSDDEDLESIALDTSNGQPIRLAAVERLAGRAEGLDPSLAALLCSTWSPEDRGLLSAATRESAALSLARNLRERNWQTWPLFYWLAAMDSDARDPFLHTLVPEQIAPDLPLDLFNAIAAEYPIIQIIAIQARRHRDACVRKAAQEFHSILARHRPDVAAPLDREAAPWLGPETNTRSGAL